MINAARDKILRFKPVASAIAHSKQVVLPGFERLPLYDVIVFFYEALHKGALTTRAASLAYNFFMAIFPSIIFLFTLIPYIPIDNFQYELFALLRKFLPYNAFEATRTTIEDILEQQRGGLLSVGFILALFFSSNGIIAMMHAFNSSFYTIEKRGPIGKWFTAMGLVLIMVLLLIIAIGLIVFSGTVIDYLVSINIINDKITVYLLQTGRWLITIALFFFGFSFLYYIGPSKKMEYKFISAGSTLATILSLITSAGFAFYVNNFSQYNKLYGSIGTLMVIMLWIYFNCIILLLGFELNASIKNAKKALYSHDDQF